MSFFHHIFHRISLPTIDPQGGGLREEIEAEQLEPEAITLDEGVVDGQLEAQWQQMQDEIKKDPDWITFSEE